MNVILAWSSGKTSLITRNVAVCTCTVCGSNRSLAIEQLCTLMIRRRTTYIYYLLHIGLSNIRAQYKDDRCVAEHGVEVGVEEMRELVYSESAIR